MPVRRSSGDSGVVKVGRKARVSIGNSRGLVDDVSTAGPKSSVVDKARGKKKFAIEGSNGGVRTVGAKKKGSNKVQNRGNSDDDASYLHVNERLTETRGRKKSNLKTQSGGEGFEAALKGNTGHKRKRISADPMVEDKIFDGNVRRSRTKSDKIMAESHLDKVKKVPRGKDRELKDTGRNTFVKENFKSRGVELDEKKIRRGKVMVADKLKYYQDNVSGTEKTKMRDKKRVELNDKKNQRGKVVVADKLKYSQENVSVNEKTKIRDKKRVPFETQKEELKQRANGVGFIEKVRKKKDHGKTNLSTDSDLAKDPPKKKKRVIRIDPYDISNKRLDDGIINNDSTEAKIVLAESTSADTSKNAQFRAIIPSPSILSFVEDNFLGRRRDIQFRRAGYNTELSAPLDNIPFSTSSERERIEVPAFRNKLEFFAAAKSSSSFPPPDLPEIAFAGRSNVGKSSLLNALTRKWGVARTSDKPGLTQSINFFKLGTKLCLVDLPGYGFAYAKDEVKEAWEELVKEYVCTRVGLKLVCLLVDTKWGMKPRDHELIDLMERSQTKYQIVLTKTDLNFPIDVARRAMQIEENLKAKKSVVQPLMMVSSKTGAGIRSLRTVLANVARLVRR